MFTVKIGAITVDVESAEIELMMREVDTIRRQQAHMYAILKRILDAVEGTPHVEFTIGPVSEQE